MLSVSSQSSNSDPQLEGHTSFLTVPHLPGMLRAAAHQALEMSIFIHFPNISLYQHFFFSLHPSALQRYHNSCPTAVLGHFSDRVPISVPRPWGSATQCRWPRAHPSSSASRNNQVPGTLSFGAPLPHGTRGEGAHTSVPLPGRFGQDCPEGSGLAPCSPRAPAACPAPPLLPLREEGSPG